MSVKLATHDFVKKITDSRVGFIYLNENEIDDQYPGIHKQGAFNVGFIITSDAYAILGFYMSWIVLQLSLIHI